MQSALPSACTQCAAPEPAHSLYTSVRSGEHVAFCSEQCDRIGQQMLIEGRHGKHAKSHSKGHSRPFEGMDPREAEHSARKGWIHDRAGHVHELSEAQRRALWARASE
jgi:hypothetical protein